MKDAFSTGGERGGRGEGRPVHWASSWQTWGFPLPDTGRSDHSLWVPPLPVSLRRDDAGQRTPQGCWWFSLCVGVSPGGVLALFHEGLLFMRNHSICLCRVYLTDQRAGVTTPSVWLIPSTPLVGSVCAEEPAE